MTNITNAEFKTASDAYNWLFSKILLDGVDFGVTKALFNVGFPILNPTDKIIHTKNRKWNLDYAEAECQGNLSVDLSIERLGKLYGKLLQI